MKRLAMGCAVVVSLVAALLESPAPGEERELLEPSELARVLRMSPLPPPPPDPSNAYADDPQAARLGQALFYDERFSKNGDVSCATCHQPGRAFTDGRETGRGMARVDRNTPTVINSAHNRWFFWDGRSDSAWSQALGPLEDPREHGGSRLQFAHLIDQEPWLRELYVEVFGSWPDLSDPERFPERGRPVPGIPEHPLARSWNTMTAADRAVVNRTFANLGKALAAYQRRLSSTRAPFDVFVEGLREQDPEKLAALSDSAIRGLKVFLGKGRCHTCHDGPYFSDLEFHMVRVPPREGSKPDIGRYGGVPVVFDDPFNSLGLYSDDPEVTGRRRLGYLVRVPHSRQEMKTPSLRNVAATAPYMHHGFFESLGQVVRFYSTLDGALPPHPSEKLVDPIGLDEREQADVVAFLRSLSDLELPEEWIGPPRAGHDSASSDL